MITALARFVDALRQEGLSISPAETLDAGRALDLVGPEHRPQFHAALKATLAKDRRATEVFDRVFERFFAAPVPRSRGRRTGEASEEPSDRRGRGSGGPPPPETSPRPKPRERESQRGKVPSQRMRDLLERARRDGERRSGRLRRVHLRETQSETAKTGEPARPAASADPVHRTLTVRMTTDEERRIAREVPRMIDALKLGVGRRLEQSPSGRPWLRRALRQSVATGGAPFVIPMRAPRRKRTRVVVLADVSFSVARASGLFLWMAASFLKLGRHSRVLVFVDRPVDATDAIRTWAATRGSEEAMPARFKEVIENLRNLNPNAPSDYGTAFHSLLASPKRPRGRNTVLVILGDGRTNRFDPLPWALEELSRGCRATLWLVPEPNARWGTGDSALPAYMESVDVVVEATDLAGLTRGLAEIIRRL